VQREAEQCGEGRREDERYLHGMFFKRVLYYLNPATLFRHTDNDMNLRFMHGINRISIFVFLVCLLVMVLRACWG
jgi:hypothetical protein